MDDLMPNIPISCLPSNRVGPKVQGHKNVIDCPQPGDQRASFNQPVVGVQQ